ncbi:MAG: hypothetical protein MJ211_02785 [Bacteroidales bacterium]|nr:hypothetical protein [Bacteroidales bacterium]
MYQSIIIYLLETAIIFTILIDFYRFTFYRLSYYKWDRIFLIFCIVICYILPTCKIHFDNKIKNYDTTGEITNIVQKENTCEITIEHEISFTNKIKDLKNSVLFYKFVKILVIIYLIGVLVKTISFIGGLKKIQKLKNKPPTKTDNGININIIKGNTIAFSFFNNIFVNQQFKDLEKTEKITVLNHEMRHIKGKHSLDVILFQVLGIFQWFNPRVKYAAKLSRQICENIADNDASKSNGVTEYTKLLLKLGEVNRNKTIQISPKNSSKTLTERIVSLFSDDSEKIRKIRFICTIPILILILVSYIVIGGINKSNKFSYYQFPIIGKYYQAVGFFNNKKYIDKKGNCYEIKHQESTFILEDNSEIISPAKGEIILINKESVNNQQYYNITIKSDSLTFNLKGLEKTEQVIGNIVKKGELLGFGKNAIPFIIKIKNGEEIINPSSILRY